MHAPGSVIRTAYIDDARDIQLIYAPNYDRYGDFIRV